MKKFKKNVKGITLIALVVTIIVLLILAGVALNLTIGQNGIFSRAQDAANTWRNAETNEQLAMQEGANLIDQYLNGNGGTGNNDSESGSGSGNDNPSTGEGTSLGDIKGNETTNTTTQDKYGNPITIPAGFKVVNPEDDVTKGIIIEDVNAGDENTKGSQFVWIPVGDVITDINGSKTTITLGRYTFDGNGIATPVQTAKEYANETQLKTSSTSSYYFQELLNTTSSQNAKAKDIKEFISKATTSHGYYIGRYEAGDDTATSSARTSSTNDDNLVVCKTGVYPYNYVTQSQASSLSQGMYSSKNFESDLINSYAWDTAIVFIQTFSGDGNYSIQVGKNTESSIKKCGESILNASYVDSGDEAQDVRCNIYDMAGNTHEWTTETYSSMSGPCVLRGSRYDYSSYGPRIRFNVTTTDSHSYYSFRPTLYL